MRKYRKTLVVGLVLAGLLASLGGFGTAFAAACRGSLDTFYTLAAARSELDPSRRPPVPPPAAIEAPAAAAAPPEAPSALGLFAAQLRRAADDGRYQALQAARTAGHASLSAFMSVKQSDTIAYPIHALLARSLEVGRCSTDAVRIQWCKAAVHAAGDDQVDQVASALRRDLRGPDDAAHLREIVDYYLDLADWSPGLHRVRAVLAPWIGT